MIRTFGEDDLDRFAVRAIVEASVLSRELERRLVAVFGTAGAEPKAVTVLR